MAVICPTITTKDPHQFRNQVELAMSVAKRIHIDVADGIFAPKLLDIKRIWVPDITTDIHMMYEYPSQVIKTIIKLKPSLVIVHFESKCNFSELAKILKAKNIKFGIAILQHTTVDEIEPLLGLVDHILIFSGHLGFFGGHVDLNLLDKVKKIKQINKDIEIGWDGGINPTNTKQLVAGSIDVLNVGGYIQKSANPLNAFNILNESIGGEA